MNYTVLTDIFKADLGDAGVTFIHRENMHDNLCYTGLKEKALAMLSFLQKKGLGKGDQLIFQLENNRNFLITFWACLFGGIVAVPLTGATHESYRLKLLKIWSKLEKASLIYEKAGIVDDLKSDITTSHSEFQPLLPLLATRAFGYEEPAGEPGIPAQTAPQDTAFIQFSSGSTGDPKGVVLSHENLITNILAIISGSHSHQQDSSLSWMPLTHDMGLIGFHLSPLFTRMNQYLMPPSLFIKKPLYWMQLVNDHKISIMCSPNFGLKYFLRVYQPQNDYQWDLSHVRLFFNGAEPISAALVNSFLDSLARYGMKRKVMFPVYGMAEASLAVTFPHPDEEMRAVTVDRASLAENTPVRLTEASSPQALTFVDLGSPVENCHLRIVDSNGQLLPDMACGQIQISGRNVTRGYYREETPALSGGGWLSTGDMGFLMNGRLVITGRLKDIIFVMGQNFYSHDIEQTVATAAGLDYEDVAACGVPDLQENQDKVVIFVKHAKNEELFTDLVTLVKSQLMLKMGLEARAVLPVLKVPRTTSGKKQRFLLLQDYQDGQFTEQEARIAALVEEKISRRMTRLTRKDVEEQLLVLLRGVMGAQSIGIHDNLADLGLTSYMIVRMIASLDQLYPGKISQTDFFSNQTLAQIARVIVNRSTYSLQPQKLPPEFFGASGNVSESGILFHTFESQVSGALSRFAAVSGLTRFHSMAAVLAYVMGRLCRGEVVFSVEMPQGDYLLADFPLSDNLLDYTARLKTLSADENLQKRFMIAGNDGLKFESGEGHFYLILHQQKKGGKAPEQAELFDAALGIAADGGPAGYELKFRNNRMSAEQMRKLVTGFQNGIRFVAQSEKKTWGIEK